MAISPGQDEQQATIGLLEAIFSLATVGMCAIDVSSGRFVKVNSKFCTLLGYSETELLALTFEQIIHPEDRDRGQALAAQMDRGLLDTYELEKRYVRKDGSTLWVHVSSSCLRDALGRALQAVRLVQDITERKYIEQQLRESEARYELVIAGTQDGIWDWDIGRNTIYWNDRFYEILGLSREEYQPNFEADWQLIHPEDRCKVEAAVEAHLKDGTPYLLEFRMRHASGQYRYLRASAQAARDEQGKAYRMAGAVTEITDAKLTAEALAESEERFRTMADSSSAIIFVTDTEPKNIYVNKSWLEYTGFSYEAAMGMGWSNAIHPDDVDGYVALFLQAYSQQTVIKTEVRLQKITGDYGWMLITAAPRYTANGTFVGYIGNGIDITDRKRAEEALAISESRFRIMADASPQIIWLLDATGQLTYVNQRALEFTQKTYEEIQEQGWVSEAIHPDDRLRVQEVFRQALQAKTFLQLEYRCRCAQGDYRWLYSVGNPCLSLQGELLGFIGSTLDITELKEAQKSLEAYARQLELSNKELEQFAFVASHDLQEPLRKVRVFAECLKQAEDCHLTPKAYDYLERMRGAAQRMQDLITGLLDLSRLNRRSQSFQTVDLNRVLTEVLGELQEYIQAVNGCVRVENLPYIKADPGQMHQLFLNLLSNALKFHRPGVPPVVTVAFEWEDGDWGRVRVEDNGIGFEPKYSEQIFDIFERLHGRGQYEGTGIGLAICKKIVERHDGTITATSTLGQGSDFTVTLPHCSKVMPEIAILS